MVDKRNMNTGRGVYT